MFQNSMGKKPAKNRQNYSNSQMFLMTLSILEKIAESVSRKKFNDGVCSVLFDLDNLIVIRFLSSFQWIVNSVPS